MVAKNKYGMNPSEINNILGSWEAIPGKWIIKLLDLPDHYRVNFSELGRELLSELIRDAEHPDHIRRNKGVDFYLLNKFIINNDSTLTIKTIRSIIKVLPELSLSLDVSRLEKEVISIHGGRRAKKFQLNGLPIDLTTKNWAYIIGIILDTCLKKHFEFTSVHEKFAEEIKQAFINVGIKPTLIKNARLTRVRGSQIISDILLIGGINTQEKQIESNLCFPSWIYHTDRVYQAILLAKLFDTEGSINLKKKMIRFTQANRVILSEQEYLTLESVSQQKIIKPSNCVSKVIFLKQISGELFEKVTSMPPLILVCIQLLLEKNGIYSSKYPTKVTIDSKNNISCLWNLHIQTNSGLKNFSNLCSKYVTIREKREKLSGFKRLKRNNIPKLLKKSYYLLLAKQIENKNGSFTVEDIIKASGRTRKTVYNTIGYIEKTGLTKTISTVKGVKQRILSAKGRTYLRKNSLVLVDLQEYLSN